MIRDPLPFLPYPPLARHGVIGDRRTAALVAADGTLDWLCLPHYDGPPLFAALLDARAGGFWRAGPARPVFGQQRYDETARCLRTRWTTDDWELELTDAMAWPWDNRAGDEGGGDGRVMLRRLRCLRGLAPVAVAILPRDDFAAPPRIARTPDGATFTLRERPLTIWTSRPAAIEPDRIDVSAALQPGEELWSVLAWGEEQPRPWTPERATALLEETDRFWRAWVGALTLPRGHRRPAAAQRDHHPSAQLRPDRLPGRRADHLPARAYRRRPQLGLPLLLGPRCRAVGGGALPGCGELAAARRYMDCLTSYQSSTDSPLQVVYGSTARSTCPSTSAGTWPATPDRRPVRIGNRACAQRQLDSLGFFDDCALTYLDSGGEWRDEHWDMVRRAADYTARPLAATGQRHLGAGRGSALRQQQGDELGGPRARGRDRRPARPRGGGGPLASGAGAIHAEVMDARLGRTAAGIPAALRRRQSRRLGAADPDRRFSPGRPSARRRHRRPHRRRARRRWVRPPLYPGPGRARRWATSKGAFLPCTFWLATVLAMAGPRDGGRSHPGQSGSDRRRTGPLRRAGRRPLPRLPRQHAPPLLPRRIRPRRPGAPDETARRQDGESVSRVSRSATSARTDQPTAESTANEPPANARSSSSPGRRPGWGGRRRGPSPPRGRGRADRAGRGRAGGGAAGDRSGRRPGAGHRRPTSPTPTAVEAAAARIERELGPIDVWVNNAMVSVFSPVKEMTAEEFRRVTEVTYLGYVYGTLAALRRMLPARPRRDRPGRLGARLPRHSPPVRLLRRQARHPGLHRVAAPRAAARREPRAGTMVQLPALNTPQFDWVKTRLPRPAATGAADLPAGGRRRRRSSGRRTHDRREVAGRTADDAGHPGRQASRPGLLDRYLARTAYAGQQTDEPVGRGSPAQPLGAGRRERPITAPTAVSTTWPARGAGNGGSPPIAASWPSRQGRRWWG